MAKKHQQCIRQVIHVDAVIPTTIIMSGEHGRKYTVTITEEYINHTNRQSIICENRDAALKEIRQQKKNRKR
jgi:hypothetical protein